METGRSVRFFDEQFRRQIERGEYALNPFEQRALPFLRGRVLDFGCGLGNLAITAARGQCDVVALDASAAAIAHVQQVALAESLPLAAIEADLRHYTPAGEFDAVACIGLLMFFDCDTALRQLRALQAHVRPGGVAIVNVLVEGTTYLDMFDPAAHCLLRRDDLHEDFAGWEVLDERIEDFPAPGDQRKRFATVIARKPQP